MKKFLIAAAIVAAAGIGVAAVLHRKHMTVYN